MTIYWLESQRSRAKDHFQGQKAYSSTREPRAGLRVEDVMRAPAVVADFRKVIRQDPRIIQKLHRRVFVDKITRDQVRHKVSGFTRA